METKQIFSEKELFEIERSAVFNMSLGSKELFHSNFLYWLALEYPKEIGSFFAEKCNLKNDIQCYDPQREVNKIDFSFNDRNGNFFYLENKVKSMPNQEQLYEYKRKTDEIISKNENKKIVPHRLLLALCEPSFELQPWIYISYEEYKNFIEKIKLKNDYHKFLIKDYLLLVNCLLKINEASNITDDDFFDFHDNEELKQLSELRIQDLFLKKKYENLSLELMKLSKCSFSELSITNSFAEKEMDIYFESGMTRSQGLMGLKFNLYDSYFLLIQIQGNSYRMGVEYLPKKIHVISEARYTEQLAHKLADKWFSFENKKNRLKDNEDKIIYPQNKKGNKEFNKYGDTFFYKSIKLGTELRIKSLKEIIIEDINKMIEIRDSLMLK